MELKQYTNQELFDLMIDTIKHSKRHPHYQHVVKHAKFCHQILTGDDQKELLVKYKRENDAQEEQRIKITNSRTQYASGKIFSVFDEVQRSDDVIELFRYKDDSDSSKKKVEEINDRLEKFYGDTVLKDYVYEAVQRLNFYDPNAFLIVNFTPFDAAVQKTDFVYPIEVYSDQALRYEYSNGNLLYLLFHQETEILDEVDGKIKKRAAHNYYLFGKDVSFEFIELPEKGPEFIFPGHQVIEIEITSEQENKPSPLPNVPATKRQIKRFQFRQYDTKSKRIPVVRVGYLLDPRTRNATCVSPLYRAEKLFLDLIWTKSEYDLCKALHWFYQKFIYAPACKFTNDEGDYCNGGHMARTGNKCPECDGTGMLVHTTVQDVIVMRLPDTSAEIVPLEQMVHYENIDVTIGKQLQEDFHGLEHDIFKAVFNSQAFDRSEVAITATEKTLDLRAVKNALISFSNQCSRVIKFCIEMTAIYTDNDEGIMINHQHPRDFKLETLDDLILKRKSVVDAGAPYQVIRNVDLAIMELQNQGNPEVIEIMKARETFRPFREKTESERMFILSGSKAEDYHLALWKHFEDIMAEIQFEDKNRGEKPWHKLAYPEQKAIIDAKVKKIQDEIKKEKEANMLMMPFRNPGGDIPPGQDDDDEDEEERTPEERQAEQVEDIANQ